MTTYDGFFSTYNFSETSVKIGVLLETYPRTKKHVSREENVAVKCNG